MYKINNNLIKNALDASSLRQRIVSSNLSNMNTPGYKVSKVEFEELLKNASQGIGMKKTHEKHFGLDQPEDIQATVEKRTNTSVDETGNNVDVDLEMTELAANEIFYSALIQLLNGEYSKLNAVINK